MSFDRPYVLFLLLVPVAAELVRRSRRSRVARYALDRWGAQGSVAARPFPRAAAFLRNALVSAGLVCLCVAAAGPVRVERSLVFLARGADVVFVVDVSPSMGAKDLSPDRFRAARRVVERFVSQDRNEAVGLVAFASEAALVCPPTTDYASVRARLASVSPGSLGEGTALGTGLAIALRHALASHGNEKRIVLLTDGENNAGAVSPETAAGLAARYGVTVTVVGVGSRGDVPIEYVDPGSGERMGGVYQSEFDEASLRGLARATGGAYLSAADDAGIDRALAELSSAIPAVERKRTSTERVPAGFGWLAAASAFFCLAWMLDRLALGGLP